jgi:ABC-type lipoprotein export system ATPase subunit
VTHDAELAAIADGRLVLRDGRVVERHGIEIERRVVTGTDA